MTIGAVGVPSSKEGAPLQEFLVRFQGRGHRLLMDGQCQRWVGGGHLWGHYSGRNVFR